MLVAAIALNWAEKPRPLTGRASTGSASDSNRVTRALIGSMIPRVVRTGRPAVSEMDADFAHAVPARWSGSPYLAPS
ncbi:MAG: hypothetical protein EOO77_38570 [Oxalobacteraceae bacterium]|nr:MAG: hypothetical protein EOO77_38570 [Oxalobacteraceae bacterium]